MDRQFNDSGRAAVYEKFGASARHFKGIRKTKLACNELTPQIHADTSHNSFAQVSVRDEVESSPSPVPQDAISPDDPRFHPICLFIQS
jgi:hypothetical protein